MPSGSRRGSDDAALVSAVITSAPLCVECIAKQTGISALRIDTVLTNLGATVKIESGAALCAACLTAKKVFRFA